MPHNFTSGYSVREPMWHRLGTVLEEYPKDWTEARRLAGLDWEAVKRPCLTLSPGLEIVVDPETGGVFVHDTNGNTTDRRIEHEDIMLVPEFAVIQRNDLWETLSVMGKDYGIVRIETMGAMLDAFLKQTNVKYETAGALMGGQFVWVLAYLDEPYCVANDRDAMGEKAMTYPYVALLNSFNGWHACKAIPTQIRVQCWNTYSACLASSAPAFTFRHTERVEEYIAGARNAMEAVQEDRERWLHLADELYALNVDEAAVQAFTIKLLPEPSEHGRPTTDRVKQNVADARAVFSGIYKESSTTEAHRGTALGLVDAATEYLDHMRKRTSAEGAFRRAMLERDPLKAKAAAWAKELGVSVKPSMSLSDLPDDRAAKAVPAKPRRTMKRA